MMWKLSSFDRLVRRRHKIERIFCAKLGKSTTRFSANVATTSANLSERRQSNASALRSSSNVGIESPRKNDRKDWSVDDAIENGTTTIANDADVDDVACNEK
jgi:hypothetical protein